MSDGPVREREPELKESLIQLENLNNRFDQLTIDLKNKIQSIHNPPQIETKSPMDMEKKVEPADLVGRINNQIDSLKTHANRVEDLLVKISRIA